MMDYRNNYNNENETNNENMMAASYHRGAYSRNLLPKIKKLLSLQRKSEPSP